MPEGILLEIRLLQEERNKLKQAEAAIDDKLNALVGLLPDIAACNNPGARP